MPELRSPIKFRVLREVEKGGVETRELAGRMGISVPHASKLLRTYWMQGLLRRSKRTMDQGGTRYFWEISPPGRRRLNYFLKNF